MKKLIGVLILMSLIACNTGIEINTECTLKHTAEMIKLQSSNQNLQTAFVNLTWTWNLGAPAGDGVIIERKIDTDFDSIGYVHPIAQPMTFVDTSDLLNPNSEVTYRLAFLAGKNIEYFDTTTFDLPDSQHVVDPDSDFINITNDTLKITFHKLQGYDTTDVVLYKTSFNDIDSLLNRSVVEILNILSNPLIEYTITDTTLKIPGADTLIDTNSIYIIKLSSSAITNLEYITDTSIGLRPFIKLP
jgi:hypothetical protein